MVLAGMRQAGARPARHVRRELSRFDLTYLPRLSTMRTLGGFRYAPGLYREARRESHAPLAFRGGIA